jgi:PAS domain S-box-containing protein
MNDLQRRRLTKLLEEIDRVLHPTGDALLAFDRDYRYFFWNLHMETMTGLVAGEVLGARAIDRFPFLAHPARKAHLDAALAGHALTARHLEFAIAETGKSGTYEAHYSPLYDGDECIAGMAVVRDTTEARRIADQMRETESRFQNMANASPVLLWMAGPDSLCTFFNQTWLDFTGRTLEEEWGVGWAEGVHFEDLQRVLDDYLDAFNDRREFEMIYRLRRKDGEYRHILDRGVPRYTPDGTFAGYIGSCVDITDRVRLETELRAAIVARDDFLSIAAHELRTPLVPIHLGVQALARLVRREHVEPGVVARRLDALEENVMRQAQLVENLLDMSRLAHGALALNPTPVELSELVREISDDFGEEARRAGSTVAVEAPAALRGEWDRQRLEQVVRNLLSNALKYGRGKPVVVEVGGGGGEARLVVRDQGIGISVVDQARIFERFARGEGTRDFGGFGLGLWITKKIVSAMGGSISVTSELGRGSTFTIRLPLAPAQCLAPPSRP